MASADERTFKNLQMDERYKKLERTLKIVLLRNTENRGADATNGTWPSISSINGDNSDTNCTALSLQSSKICSEVVSSSSNLRNIMMNKKFHGTYKNIATSSENQFPTNKNMDDDSAMMPPPRLPGLSYLRTKKFGIESQHPMKVAANAKNDHDFSMTSLADEIPRPKSTNHAEDARSSLLDGKDDHCRNSYDKCNSNAQLTKVQERIFSRWRVLLNDKGQLIIKGTLECGKIARSKPVIRRLTATSVQSIFKHTYHLKGNLVDDRNELPDYVSGKFYNGFPEDWENVYEVWRNYVAQGSNLSFRWPTPISDSDDDIKSGITEISCGPTIKRRKNSRSPRKRLRTSHTLSTTSPCILNKENYSVNTLCSCSPIRNAPVESPLKSSAIASKSISRNRSRDKAFENEASGSGVEHEKSKSLHEMSASNFDTDRTVAGNSLTDIIREDKINLIIDNLTNKNCSHEYIQKIVEMFDCMKYVVSYQATSPNNSRNGKSVPSASKELARSYVEKNSSPQGINNYKAVANNSLKTSSHKNISRENADGSEITDPSDGPLDGGKVRRNLMRKRYDSSDSENDYVPSPRRSSAKSHSFLNREMSKNRRYQDWSSTPAGFKQPFSDSGINVGASQRMCRESISGCHGNDSNVSEKFLTRNFSSNNRIYENPTNREITEMYENMRDDYSGISLIEDDKDNRNEKFNDSCVSITEDEQSNVCAFRDNLRSSKSYLEQKLHPLKPHASNVDYSDLDERKLRYHPETESHPFGTNIERDHDGRTKYEKISNFRKSLGNYRNSTGVSVRMTNNRSIEDTRGEPPEDSAYMSEVKQKNVGPFIDVETESNHLYPCNLVKQSELQRNFETSDVRIPNTKNSQDKPVVVRSEIVNYRQFNPPSTNNENENYKRACIPDDQKSENYQATMSPKNTQKILIDQRSVSYETPGSPKNAQKIQKNLENVLSSPGTKVAETIATKVGEKDTDIRVGKSVRRDKSFDNVTQKEEAKKTVVAKFGSEENPKQLSGWTPAVICDNENGNTKFGLIFEGKLLNEAGHVVSRKFATDIVKRRLSSKLIETVDHVFYQLVGDLNDTKHVVPADLIKRCRTGCPIDISKFCEKWDFLSAGSNQTPSKIRSHNTSVDNLGLPTSSRGRRILPPLNYWDGERIATKDNKAIYSPGNCQESSIPSSLEKTADEITEKNNLSKRTRDKRVQDVSPTGTKNKDAEKKLSLDSGKSLMKSTQSRRSKRNDKTRLARKLHASSSESDEEEKMRHRKRKTKMDSCGLNTDAGSTEKVQNHSTNNIPLQSLEQTRCPHPFEKPGTTETKSRLRCRTNRGQEDGRTIIPKNPKQSMTRTESPKVQYKFYKNVQPLDDDLSEDQLSVM